MAILEKLRSETRENHRLLDSSTVLLPLTEGEINKDQYFTILKLFYGYFYPVEVALNNFIGIKDYLPDLHSRRKVEWIRRDLEINNIIGDIPLAQDIPEINSLSQALGCIYVLEGSTLGGRVIFKSIKKRLGMDETNGVSFFYGYGPDTSKKWNLFQKALTDYTSSIHNQEEIIIDSANKTFAKLHTWLNTSQV